MKRDELIARLREFADYLEGRDFGDTDFGAPGFLVSCSTPKEFRDRVRAMGAFKKQADGGYFNAVKMFGDLKLEVYIVRDMVCQKVEVGTRIVPGEPERIIPATPDRTEPMYDYHCPDSVLGLGDEPEAEKALETMIVEAGKQIEEEIPEYFGPESERLPSEEVPL